MLVLQGIKSGTQSGDANLSLRANNAGTGACFGNSCNAVYSPIISLAFHLQTREGVNVNGGDRAVIDRLLVTGLLVCSGSGPLEGGEGLDLLCELLDGHQVLLHLLAQGLQQ